MPDFEESKHPRDGDGKFGSGSGSGSGSAKLTPTEKTHLEMYSGDDFHRVNAALRGGQDPGGSMVKSVDKAIAKNPLPKGTVLYRAMSKEAARKLFPGGDIQSGMEVSDRAYASTTKSAEVAGLLGVGGIVLKIETGDGATGLDMEGISRNPQEQEVLLPRDAKMTVLGIRPPKETGGPAVVRVRYGKYQVKADAAENGMDTEEVAETLVEAPLKRAAGILFLDRAGHILLLRRAGGDHGGEWAFPGGGIEDGETPEAAARRETVEEVGFTYEGPLTEMMRRVKDDVDFTTFIAQVDRFEPTLNAEHTDAFWCPRDVAAGMNLHPGARVSVLRLDMDELGIGKAMRAGDISGPQRYANIFLVAMRITGTGLAYRVGIKEYTWRDPSMYCNPHFVERCNGLPVVWLHNQDLLDGAEIVKRLVGTMFLPWVKDDEVWGIAKIYDEGAARMLMDKAMSTSPFVAFSKADEGVKIPMPDGKHALIEGNPTFLDSVAICPVGVWDKGSGPAGIEYQTEPTPQEESQVPAVNTAAQLDVAQGLIRANALDQACRLIAA